MAERPTGANRPMAKRTREPLADTNSIISEPTIEKGLILLKFIQCVCILIFSGLDNFSCFKECLILTLSYSSII